MRGAFRDKMASGACFIRNYKHDAQVSVLVVESHSPALRACFERHVGRSPSVRTQKHIPFGSNFRGLSSTGHVVREGLVLLPRTGCFPRRQIK